MVKVCVMTSAHPVRDIRVFHKQCRSLAKAGYSVTYLVPHDRMEAIDGVKIKPLKKGKGRLSRFTTTNIDLAIKALKQDADIFHYHDPELFWIGLLLKLKGKIVIADFHEYYIAVARESKWIKYDILKRLAAGMVWISNQLVNLCFDHIVVVSERTGECFSKNKVTRIQNFPILTEFARKKEDADTSLSPYIAYAGAINDNTCIPEILDALLEVNKKQNCSLKLMGKIPENYIKKITAHPAAEKVEYLGLLPREKMIPVLQSAYAGIALYKPDSINNQNGQPNKNFEFMALGKPVITNNFPATLPYIEGTNSGLCIRSDDVGQISGAILKLLENPEEAQKMGENGYNAVHERFNWSTQEEILLDLYKTLCKKHRL